MADASALAGLLDRASNVFSLARELGREFKQGFDEQSPVNIIWPGEVNPRQKHRDKINEFIAAVQGLREETKNPPEGFAGVADVLRRAAETARLMATSPHWEPYESWPYLNQHAQDGYEAVKAARADMPKDDPWDFSPSAPAPAADMRIAQLNGIGQTVEALAERLLNPDLSDAIAEADRAAYRPLGEPGEVTGEPATISPTGFLGGAALADALGIHATRRDAFFRQLERQRMSLGDNCWHEVREPRPNSPRFLYRADSPKLRSLAAAYATPKLA
ncbi:MAG: hypothetical protein KF847_19060 [Pirellulales bacterium]|nr:hypothetical protein [Pirellulales bacterium]